MTADRLTIAGHDPVNDYYNRNTGRFLRYGGGGQAAAIHRQLWAPGVIDVNQAFLYVNALVSRAIQPALEGAPEARLLDLGCGVGGTATWIAERVGAQVIGVTNSSVQVQLAQERAAHLGLAQTCSFVQADFLDLPDLGQIQAAWAIESFAHACDGYRFLEQAASSLAEGGRLVICDDFLSEEMRIGNSMEAATWVERFRRGWRLGNLYTPSQVDSLVRQFGLRLVQAYDLSSYLRPFSPGRMALMKLLTTLPLRSAYWDNLTGGTALQVCQARGWIQYHLLVWEKSNPDPIGSYNQA